MFAVEICRSKTDIGLNTGNLSLRFNPEGAINSQGTLIEFLNCRLPCDFDSCSKVCSDCQITMAARCAQGANAGYVTVLTGVQPVTFAYVDGLLRSFEKRGA